MTLAAFKQHKTSRIFVTNPGLEGEAPAEL